MAEEDNTNQGENNTENEAPTVEQLAEQLAQLKSENEKLSTKRGLAEKHLSEKEKKLSEYEQRIAEIEAEKEKAAEADMIKKGDFDSYKKSILEKHTKDLSSFEEKLSAKDKQIAALTIESDARSIASEIYGENAKLLLPHIKQFLRVGQDENGMPQTEILNEQGELTALGLDGFKDFLRNHPELGRLSVASKASGGGATGGNKGGGGATQKTIKRSQFDSMSQNERRKFSLEGGRVVD